MTDTPSGAAALRREPYAPVTQKLLYIQEWSDFLDKLSRKILKEFTSHGKPDYSCGYSNNQKKTDTTLFRLAETLGTDTESIRNAIFYLEDLGYLQAVFDVYPTAGKYRLGTKLTHKGLHYIEFEKEEKHRFFLRSVIVPIVVSVITTLIVTALQQLWPLIVRLLASFRG